MSTVHYRRSVAQHDGRRRRGIATRARIMAAAADHFAASGFDGTSIQTVAAAADITVAAIYRHFPSKADLLVAVAHDALETTFAETIGESEALTPDRVADIVIAYVTPERAHTRRLVIELTHAAGRHPKVASSLQQFHRRARDHIARVLASSQGDGDIPADLDVRLAARDVLLLIMGVCHIDTLDPTALRDRAWRASLRRTVAAAIGTPATTVT
jgi:AcrR family transcriptional regulator